MAPESHGEKKGWSGLFYPPNGLNFQFCWFNLIFLIAPSWSESNFILFLFFYSIRVGPSWSDPDWRSKLIRSDFCTCLFWKTSFGKKRTDYVCKTSIVQDFVTGKNFSFNQCHNKEFCIFSWESYFIKAIKNFFPVFA